MNHSDSSKLYCRELSNSTCEKNVYERAILVFSAIVQSYYPVYSSTENATVPTIVQPLSWFGLMTTAHRKSMQGKPVKLEMEYFERTLTGKRGHRGKLWLISGPFVL